MKMVSRLFTVILLILILAACNLPGMLDQDASTPQNGQGEESKATEPDTTMAEASETEDQEADSDTEGSEVEVTEATQIAEIVKDIDFCELPGETRQTWFDLSTFIFIPATSFQMGFDNPDEELDHEPSHPVQLSAFWMHETEVTNRQYANCVNAGDCEPPAQTQDVPYWYEQTQRLDDPVVGVSWEQADAYCEWLGARLPTEAEWELAARGKESFSYPWGMENPDCQHANYEGCQEPDDSQPVIAGSIHEGISPFEMLDMTGNVHEWVKDWYAPDYYLRSPASNPGGPETGEQRVWRGGGYLTPAGQLQTYLRNVLEPEETRPDLGFRCALECGLDAPPRMCYMPPIVGDVPFGDHVVPIPEISINAYCEEREGKPYTGVVLSPPNIVDLSQFDLSSPDGEITCDLVEEKLVCYGPAIQQDFYVKLTVCPDCKPGFFFDQLLGTCQFQVDIETSSEDSSCPPGWEYIEEFDSCYIETQTLPNLCSLSQYITPTLPSPEICQPQIAPESACLPFHYYTENCGCILQGTTCEELLAPVEEGPIAAIQNLDALINDQGTPLGEINPDFFLPLELMPDQPGGIDIDPNWTPQPEDCGLDDQLGWCPAGKIPLEHNGCLVCIPVPTKPECATGFNYNPAVNCCTPETPGIACPRLTTFDPVTNSCIPIPQGNICFELSVYVPACPTPVPPTEVPPTPVPVCTNPEQYNDRESCINAGCAWRRPAVGGPYQCVQP